MDEVLLAERLIAYDTSRRSGLSQATDFVAGWLEARGAHVDPVETGGRRSLMARGGPGPSVSVPCETRGRRSADLCAALAAGRRPASPRGGRGPRRHARSSRRAKRGGGRSKVSWDDVVHAVSTDEDPGLVLSLDDVITKLSGEHERYGLIVEMRVFADLKNQEMADVLGVSLGTVEKDWRDIRPKLLEMLGEGEA